MTAKLLTASRKPGRALCVFSHADTTWFLCWVRRDVDPACVSVCSHFQLPGLCSPARCREAPCPASAHRNAHMHTHTPFPAALMGKLRHNHMHSPSRGWQQTKDLDSQGKPFFETLF